VNVDLFMTISHTFSSTFLCFLQTWPSRLMPSLADLGSQLAKGSCPQDAKTPGRHITMCVLILSAFGVSAQFGPLQLYSLDPPVHAIVGQELIRR